MYAPVALPQPKVAGRQWDGGRIEKQLSPSDSGVGRSYIDLVSPRSGDGDRKGPLGRHRLSHNAPAELDAKGMPKTDVGSVRGGVARGVSSEVGSSVPVAGSRDQPAGSLVPPPGIVQSGTASRRGPSFRIPPRLQVDVRAPPDTVKAALRRAALSALPDVEDAPLRHVSLRFVAEHLQQQYDDYVRATLPTMLLWRIGLAFGACVMLAVCTSFVYGRLDVLLLAAACLLLLWGGGVCMASASSRLFAAVNTIMCTAVMAALTSQPFVPATGGMGDVGVGWGNEHISRAALHVVPWATLLPAACGLCWSTTLRASALWFAYLAVLCIALVPYPADVVAQLLLQAVAVTALVLVFAYRAARLRRQVWYLAEGSLAAHARQVAMRQAHQPARQPQEYMVPLMRVVELLSSAKDRERSRELAQSMQQCLDVVYTHGSFVAPPHVQKRMMQQLARDGEFMDQATDAWLSKELVQQVPMLSKFSKSRMSLDSTRRLHNLEGGPPSKRSTARRTGLASTGMATGRGAGTGAGAGAGSGPEAISGNTGSSGLPMRRRSANSATSASVHPLRRPQARTGELVPLWGSAGSVGGSVEEKGARTVPITAVAGLSDAALVDAEATVTDWAFDVLDWAEKCKQPMTWTAETLFVKFGLMQKLQLNPRVMRRFLSRVEKDYCFDELKPNPYHNNVHAAFVVQAVGHFLTVKRIATLLHDLDALAILVAAVAHDFRHPGVSSNYLVTTESKLATRYNDISVLEKFHCAETFELMQEPSMNILGELSKEKRAHIRFVVIQCVLATDLAHGQKFASRFKAKIRRSAMTASDEDKLLLMQILLKCADVSHPARPLRIHKKWSTLISEEFYMQGDIEREKGLPLSPLCDRYDANLPRSQRGFICFVCQGVFSSFGRFCRVDLWPQMLRLNKAYWRSQEEAQADEAPRSAEGEPLEDKVAAAPVARRALNTRVFSGISESPQSSPGMRSGRESFPSLPDDDMEELLLDSGLSGADGDDDSSAAGGRRI